jgi:hypothetical protein
MMFNDQREPFHYGTTIKSHSTDKNVIHFLHLINIGHAPLFHIVSYMEIFFLIFHYQYKNERTKNSSMCLKAYVFKYLE